MKRRILTVAVAVIGLSVVAPAAHAATTVPPVCVRQALPLGGNLQVGYCP